MKKTVVLGASPDASRYSNLASRMLNQAGFEFVPVGIKSGVIDGKEILDIRKKPKIEHVHTVTIYMNPNNQKEWYEYIFDLNPKRIIFNPGTENMERAKLAKKKGIETEFACNLVLVQTGQF